MNSLRVLYHMMRADLLERTRRYSFLIMLLAVIYLGYAVNNGMIFLALDDYRGIYNSAWVGSLMVLVIVTFLGWFGFYLIKNTIERDERTGVGQIIATTPLTRVQYTLGKWLSNFALLAILCLILAFAAVIMQLLQREAAAIDLWALLAPFLFVALPLMALIAALAVLFETIPFLRGGFGNVVYFFLFIFMLIFSIEMLGKTYPRWEPMGMRLITMDMAEELLQIDPGYNVENFNLGMADKGALKTFLWTGMDWTPGLIALRLSWIVISAGIAAGSAVFFNRFDPSTRSVRRFRRKPKGGGLVEAPLMIETVAAEQPAKPNRLAWFDALSARLMPHPVFLRLVAAELRLMFKGQPKIWYLGAVVIVIGGLFSPPEAVRQGWLLAAAIWPLLLWSQMGVRENRYATSSIVFSAPSPLLHQLPATWLAGVLVAIIISVGAGVHWISSVNGTLLLAWVLFVLFVPSLALALGVWSGTNKLFEVVYLLIWYIGPLNQLPALDYLGIGPDALVLRQPLILGFAILLLLVLAVIGRQKRLSM
jgi:hypothetical protein